MKRYGKPTVGSEVEVTTKWKNIWLFAKEPWEYHTVRGVVRPSNYWDAPNTFKITTGIAIYPEAIVPLDKIVSIKYFKGKPGKTIAADSKIKLVKGSKGNVYTVTKTGNKYSCTCPGFTFRRSCKHLKEIEE